MGILEARNKMAGILEILGLSIPSYVWIGILLIILGLVIATFIPVIGQKVGILMVLLGLVLSVGFTVIKNLFEDPTFVAILIGGVTLVVVLWILFPQNVNETIKK
jgi:drug/metabolite transporter (DMT)-like permease